MPADRTKDGRQRLFLAEGLQAANGLGRGDALATVVEVDEDVTVIAHAEFLHVGQLTQAMTGLDALDEVVVLGLGHGVDEVDTGLIEGKDIRGRKDADVRGDDIRNQDLFTIS